MNNFKIKKFMRVKGKSQKIYKINKDLDQNKNQTNKINKDCKNKILMLNNLEMMMRILEINKVNLDQINNKFQMKKIMDRIQNFKIKINNNKMIKKNFRMYLMILVIHLNILKRKIKEFKKEKKSSIKIKILLKIQKVQVIKI